MACMASKTSHRLIQVQEVASVSDQAEVSNCDANFTRANGSKLKANEFQLQFPNVTSYEQMTVTPANYATIKLPP